jgi:hypothetical protein
MNKPSGLARGSRSLLMVAMTGAFSCGLISSDIATISFNLPERTYSFNTNDTGWNSAKAAAFGTAPVIPCSVDADCQAPLTLVGVDPSFVICDQPTQSCAFVITVETPPQTIDIKSQSPELSRFSNQSLVDVTVSKITYDIDNNSMNVDLPAVELFVAPQGVTTTSDPAATRFGTVPPIPAHMDSKDGNVALDKAGQDAFVGFAHHFGTPFVFLARSRVVVPGGTPVPMGGLSLTVKGRLSAKPSL